MLTYKYGHNQLGQRIVEEKTSAEQCKLTRYTFNARRELIASDRRIGNGCGVVTNYRYDLNHNRIGQNQYRYQHNAADQLLNYPGPGPAATLSYNSQGQASQVGNLALTYNQSQQIKTAQNGSTYARYEYDASGRRMAKEVNGEREEYLMLGQEVLKTFDGSGNVKADYFLGLGRQGIKTDGSWKYYLSDGLGSTALLTDGSGNTVAAYDYEDYGEASQIAGAASVYNPFRYTGREWDAELGMYNLRARHYSPSLGRFLARDPIGYSGGSNLMAYCQGDPVDFIDPSGTKLEIEGDDIRLVAKSLMNGSATGKALLQKFFDDQNFILVLRNRPSSEFSAENPNNPGAFHAWESKSVAYVCDTTTKKHSLVGNLFYVDIDLSITSLPNGSGLLPAAVLAHELGHAFEWFYRLDETIEASKDEHQYEDAAIKWENAVRSELSLPLRDYY